MKQVGTIMSRTITWVLCLPILQWASSQTEVEEVHTQNLEAKVQLLNKLSKVRQKRINQFLKKVKIHLCQLVMR